MGFAILNVRELLGSQRGRSEVDKVSAIHFAIILLGHWYGNKDCLPKNAMPAGG